MTDPLAQIASCPLFPENLTVVEIETGQGKPWAFLPFEDQKADMAFLDDGLVLAIGEDRGYAVFDCATRRRLTLSEVAERGSKAWAFCKHRKVLFVADGDGSLVEGYTWRRMNGVREIPLNGDPERFHLIASDFLVSQMVVRYDGRIVVEGSGRVGVLDTRTGDVSLSRAEDFKFSIPHMALTRLRWLSPDGRWALRSHVGSVIRHVPGETPDKAEDERHPDLQGEGETQYGLALDLFGLDPLAFDRRLIVHYRTPKMFAIACGEGEERRALIDALADQVDYRTWNGRDQLLMTNQPVTSPDPDYEARRPLDELVARVLLAPIRHVRWDDDCQGFTVIVNEQERHVTLDGRAGPLRPTDWSDRRQDPAWPSEGAIKALRRRVRDRTVQRLNVTDLSASGLREAVAAMADRLDRGLEAITFRDVLQFRFKVGGKTIGEAALFKAVRALPEQDASPLLPDLRRLIGSFGDQARRYVSETFGCISSGGDPETLRVALADAALALAELDPASVDVLRGWFEAVDQEHDLFAAEKVFPAMARKTGFRQPDAVRFGLWFSFQQSQTTSYEITDFPILAHARTLWTPAEFAQVALEEAERVADREEPGQTASSLDTAYCVLEDLLDPGNAWDASALAEADAIFPKE